MTPETWLDLHGEDPFTEHDAILTAAMDEHVADLCPECGATWPSIVGTRTGYQVICSECGATIQDVDLS